MQKRWFSFFGAQMKRSSRYRKISVFDAEELKYVTEDISEEEE